MAGVKSCLSQTAEAHYGLAQFLLDRVGFLRLTRPSDPAFLARSLSLDQLVQPGRCHSYMLPWTLKVAEIKSNGPVRLFVPVSRIMLSHTRFPATHAGSPPVLGVSVPVVTVRIPAAPLVTLTGPAFAIVGASTAAPPAHPSPSV